MCILNLVRMTIFYYRECSNQNIFPDDDFPQIHQFVAAMKPLGRSLQIKGEALALSDKEVASNLQY
ncbi:hypothetical protein CCAN12_760009 [Capnocytophaga canimorsus]|uniref:Uncharacterized protein n=1 Tax=Capnocytophaga canimorsus TaxID=28188 RepID=A0A0B7HHR7_9FLAO|nr:hypothetical protein CCAN12_760009 [Capnocytophaga canimorsus]